MTFVSFIVPVVLSIACWELFRYATRDVEFVQNALHSTWSLILTTFVFMMVVINVWNLVLHKFLPAYFP